jgi:hypothetical protein
VREAECTRLARKKEREGRRRIDNMMRMRIYNETE